MSLLLLCFGGGGARCHVRTVDDGSLSKVSKRSHLGCNGARHDELHAAISDGRNRRVPRGPARPRPRPRPRPRRRCMETVPGPRRKRKTRFLNPFLVLRLPTRESSRSDTGGGGRVPHKTPEERRRPVPLIWCALSKNEAESQQEAWEVGSRPWLRGICPGIVCLRQFLIGCDQEVPEKLPCPFPSPSPLSTAYCVNDRKQNVAQRLTRAVGPCVILRRGLKGAADEARSFSLKTQDVSLTRRRRPKRRRREFKGPKPGWGPDWWLWCRDGSLGPRRRLWRTTKSRLGATSTRSRFQVCIWRRPVSDGHARLSVACLHHAVSRVHGTYLPSSLRGPRSFTHGQDRSAKRSVGGEARNLGRGGRRRPSDAGRVCLTGRDQVRRKHAGVQGCRCEQVGSRRMDGGRMLRESMLVVGTSHWGGGAPLSPTWVGELVGPNNQEGIARLEIETILGNVAVIFHCFTARVCIHRKYSSCLGTRESEGDLSG
ncbi:hypothetical protein B0T18DRAFT_16253 [Schizothecium vesticola]|uniref:Uncharacterized protein n=1 Tax=Schizothecium vesticola TaxID=314040 RepID=A0AA40F939_9PEZI|nr:hypothetical protein B0T18DRAFT_16253 [Schizothecium vesticola]